MEYRKYIKYKNIFMNRFMFIFLGNVEVTKKFKFMINQFYRSYNL